MDGLLAYNQLLAANTQAYDDALSEASRKNELKSEAEEKAKSVVEPISTEFLREGFAPIGKFVSRKVADALGDNFKPVKNILSDYNEGGLKQVFSGSLERGIQKPLQEQLEDIKSKATEQVKQYLPSEDDLIEKAFAKANPERSAEDVKAAVSSLKNKDEFLRQYREQPNLDQSLSDDDIEAFRASRVAKLLKKGKSIAQDEIKQTPELGEELQPGYRLIADVTGRASQIAKPQEIVGEAAQRARQAVTLPPGAEIEDIGQEYMPDMNELAIDGPSMSERLSGLTGKLESPIESATAKELGSAAEKAGQDASDAVGKAISSVTKEGEDIGKSVVKSAVKDTAEEAAEGAAETALDFDPITAPLGVALGLTGILFGGGIFDHHKHHNAPAMVNSSSQFGV